MKHLRSSKQYNTLLNYPNLCCINNKHQKQDSDYPNNWGNGCDWGQVPRAFYWLGNVLFLKLSDGGSTRALITLLFINFIWFIIEKKWVWETQKMGEECSRPRSHDAKMIVTWGRLEWTKHETHEERGTMERRLGGQVGSLDYSKEFDFLPRQRGALGQFWA